VVFLSIVVGLVFGRCPVESAAHSFENVRVRTDRSEGSHSPFGVVADVGCFSVFALIISVNKDEHQDESQGRHEVELAEMVVHLEEALANALDETHQRKPKEKEPEQANEDSGD